MKSMPERARQRLARRRASRATNSGTASRPRAPAPARERARRCTRPAPSRSRPTDRAAPDGSRSGGRNRASPAPARPARSARPTGRTARVAPLPAATSTIDQIDVLLGAARDHAAAGVERQARAVEHQIVLSAHLVHEHQRPLPAATRSPPACAGAGGASDRVRRGGDVDDHLGARAHQRLDRIAAVEAVRPEIGVVPDVLADRKPEHVARGRAPARPRPRLRSNATRRTRRRSGSSDLRTTCATRPPSISAALLATARPDGPRGRRSGKPTTTAVRDARQPSRQRGERRAPRRRENRHARAGRAAGSRPAPARERPPARRPARSAVGGRLEHEPAVALEVANGRVDLSERDLHAHIVPASLPGAGRQGRGPRDKIESCTVGAPAKSGDTPVPTTSRDLIAATQPLDVPRRNRVYVNRNLRLDKIEMVGFDMDYTLALYNQARIEELSMRATLHKLVTAKGYPAEIQGLAYDPMLAVRGLVVDRINGNIFKPDRYGFPGRARHGLSNIDRAHGRRAVPARTHAAVQPALRLDRFAVRAARGGALRLPGRLLRPPRHARQARLRDAVGRTSASASTWRTATDRSRRSSARSCPTSSSATKGWQTRCTSSARRGSGCSC